MEARITALLDSIKPAEKARVYNLLEQVGIDVSDWANFKGGKAKAAANPRYCYNWSFIKPDEFVVVCIWHAEIDERDGVVIHKNNLRIAGAARFGASAAMWTRRATNTDSHIQKAYLEQLPVIAILLDGKRRDRSDPHAEPSEVSARRLDDVRWAITEYNFETGDCVFVRGIEPVVPSGDDAEVSAFEGTQRGYFRMHRHREARLRRAKIAEAMKRNGGRLTCEVPGCGFDFLARYGLIGKGYAHVHHLVELRTASADGRRTKLSELAIVCANCHAMIHVDGKCRALNELIAAS